MLLPETGYFQMSVISDNESNKFVFPPDEAEENPKLKSQKLKEMLKQYNKKKEKIISEQIKLRAPPLSAKNSSKPAALDKRVKSNGSKHCDHSQPSHKASNHDLIVNVEEELYEAKFEIADAKKCCRTCKEMREALV